MSVNPQRPERSPATAIAAVKMLMGSPTAPRLSMQGTSMLPLLSEPMVLELAPIEQGLRRGDIVVFEHEGKLIAHRVTRINDGVIETCGDARPRSPEYPDPHAILGKVNAVYAGERNGSQRLDTPVFRMQGALYARTRGLRAAAAWPAIYARALWGALPWKRRRPYLALVEAMAAIVQNDGARFEDALARVGVPELVAVAERHGCSAALVEAATAFRSTSDAAERLRRELQPAGRTAALRNLALKGQVLSAIAALAERDVPFALLKGAARQYVGGSNAVLHASSDIDILVPASHLDAAVTALYAHRYYEREFALMRDRYQARHHHAAPLFPPTPGYSVELHTRLAPPGGLSTPLDWEGLQKFLVATPGPAGPVLYLDDVGSALHLAVHSIGQFRLRDTVLLAQLLARMDEQQYATLQRIAADERIEPIRLDASFALAARIAGRSWPTSRAVERYLEWSTRREDIPLHFARRSSLAEAWYAGRRITPLIWRLLDPNHGLIRQPVWSSGRAVLGRAVTSLVALVYTRAMNDDGTKRGEAC